MRTVDLAANIGSKGDVSVSKTAEILRALRTGSSHFSGIDLSLEDALKAKPGPGGGRDATSFHACFLLIAMFLNAPRRELAERTYRVYHIYTDLEAVCETDTGIPDGLRCPITGALMFGHALQAIMDNVDLAASIDRVTFDPDGHFAEIVTYDGNISQFERSIPSPAPLVRHSVTIDGELLQSTAMWLLK